MPSEHHANPTNDPVNSNAATSQTKKGKSRTQMNFAHSNAAVSGPSQRQRSATVALSGTAVAMLPSSAPVASSILEASSGPRQPFQMHGGGLPPSARTHAWHGQPRIQ